MTGFSPDHVLSLSLVFSVHYWDREEFRDPLLKLIHILSSQGNRSIYMGYFRQTHTGSARPSPQLDPLMATGLSRGRNNGIGKSVTQMLLALWGKVSQYFLQQVMKLAGTSLWE